MNSRRSISKLFQRLKMADVRVVSVKDLCELLERLEWRGVPPVSVAESLDSVRRPSGRGGYPPVIDVLKMLTDLRAERDQIPCS